ncbi:unnamed protein product, partial [Amoebophrya sp. A120]
PRARSGSLSSVASLLSSSESQEQTTASNTKKANTNSAAAVVVHTAEKKTATAPVQLPELNGITNGVTVGKKKNTPWGLSDTLPMFVREHEHRMATDENYARKAVELPYTLAGEKAEQVRKFYETRQPQQNKNSVNQGYCERAPLGVRSPHLKTVNFYLA